MRVFTFLPPPAAALPLCVKNESTTSLNFPAPAAAGRLQMIINIIICMSVDGFYGVVSISYNIKKYSTTVIDVIRGFHGFDAYPSNFLEIRCNTVTVKDHAENSVNLKLTNRFRN